MPQNQDFEVLKASIGDFPGQRVASFPSTRMNAPSIPPHVRSARALSAGELAELEALGLLDASGELADPGAASAPERSPANVARSAISSPAVLNEAHRYQPTPASFSRGLRVDLRAGASFLYISGTASVDEHGRTVHAGDLRAQCWRTFRNITELLRSEGASWQDVVRTTCYLQDIERDYEEFNRVRTYFLASQKLDPLPASTGIQAKLCRPDLLVEIEAIAVLERAAGRPSPRP